MRYLILILFLIIFTSCVDNEKVLDNGVKLKYIKNGSGKTIMDGEILELNIEYLDYEGESIFKSEDPILQQKDSLWSNIPFLNVLSNLKVGDSVYFQLTYDQFLGFIPGADYPDSIGGEFMNFYAGIESIMTQEVFEEKQREQYEKMKMNDDKQLSIDLELIDNYLKENNINATRTESGLRIVVEKKGEGRLAAPGDNVSVHYTGMLLNGEVFDSSLERQPLSFKLGQGMVIKGWDEGITYFNKNSKGTIYIPSNLGYGANGAGGVIPPNAVLVFEVELIDY